MPHRRGRRESEPMLHPDDRNTPSDAGRHRAQTRRTEARMHLHPDCNDSIRRDGPPSRATRIVGDPASPRRTAEISERMRDGYYASPAAIDQLARRLLASGELP